MSKPYFSIIIPVYNRAKEIHRALASCFSQNYSDFEVIVVDDGSTDNTIESIRTFQDERLLLLENVENKGVCVSRNHGVMHSAGEWVLLLDSDDELLPDALQCIYDHTLACPPNIERIGFMYRRDDGGTSPYPIPLQTSVLDYAGFIKWRAEVIESDFFHCTRRHTFDCVQFSVGRTYEDSYLLDFAAQYRTMMVPDFAALIHTDSDNRASNFSQNERVAVFLRDAPDQYETINKLLVLHGQALYHHAPIRYRIYQKARVLYALLAGQKKNGSKLACNYLKQYPFCMQGWVIWVAGMFGPRFLARVKALKIRVAI